MVIEYNVVSIMNRYLLAYKLISYKRQYWQNKKDFPPSIVVIDPKLKKEYICRENHCFTLLTLKNRTK